MVHAGAPAPTTCSASNATRVATATPGFSTYRPKHVEGTTFTPGSFRAKVVVYDYARGAPVCQITFSAQSSDGLAKALAAYSRRPKADVVMDDYVREIRREGNAALGQASAMALSFDW